MFETAVEPSLAEFCAQHDLYLDGRRPRRARTGAKVTWEDDLGNKHDLDHVIERGGTEDERGIPAAFIETAWRRYTKHSKNKAQEMQAAVLPVLAKWRHVRPFGGAMLAGEFTAASLTQLRSNGFAVLHISYATIIDVFSYAGIDAYFDESTSDAHLRNQIDLYEALTDAEREAIGASLRRAARDEIEGFITELGTTILRRIVKVSILPLHGSTTTVGSVASAIQLLRHYSQPQDIPALIRFEVSVRYDNDDRIESPRTSRTRPTPSHFSNRSTSNRLVAASTEPGLERVQPTREGPSPRLGGSRAGGAGDNPGGARRHRSSRPLRPRRRRRLYELSGDGALALSIDDALRGPGARSGGSLASARRVTVGFMKPSRNALCNCGSGRKYKRCCLARAARMVAGTRRHDSLGSRVKEWAERELSAELEAARAEFGPIENANQAFIFDSWFHSDRPTATGSTPVVMYAARSEIGAAERAEVAPMASARLGLYRVIAATAGSSIVLSDLLGERTVEVYSRDVSAAVARWDILLARLMEGHGLDPPTLWASVRPMSDAEGEVVIAEIERIAGERGGSASEALASRSLEIFRFTPPVPTWAVFTPEGDRLEEWQTELKLSDCEAARRVLSKLGAVPLDDEPEVLALSMIQPRRALLARREGAELPPGSVVLESGVNGFDQIAVADLELDHDRLKLTACSRPRFEWALGAMHDEFGELVEAVGTESVRSLDELRAERDRRGPEHGRDDAEPSLLERVWLAEAFRRRSLGWADDSNPELGGATPREAVAAGRDAEVLPLAVRAENGISRTRFGGVAVEEVDLLGELGLEFDAAA